MTNDINLDNFYNDFSSFSKKIITELMISFGEKLDAETKDLKKTMKYIESPDGLPSLTNNLILYYNQCWMNYHEKNNDHVIKYIDKISEHNFTTHESCLFGFLFHHSKKMLEFIVDYIIKNPLSEEKKVTKIEDYKRIIVYLTILMDSSMKKQFLKMNETYICNDRCKPYKYVKGEKLINIK